MNSIIAKFVCSVLVSSILPSSGLGAVFNANVDFGAVGNGTIDDTPRLQKFLNAVTASHGEGIIKSGDYRITAMLKINNAHHFKVRGLSQIGGKANVGSYGVRILWDGPANGIPIRLTDVRDAEISNLFIGARASRTILAALDIDGDNSTYNLFENLMIDRYAGSITTGVRICATAPTGCDLLLFRRLFVRGTGQAVWIIGSQSKWHSFESSQFIGSVYGVRTSSGSFSLYHPNFSNNQTDISIGEVSDAISIVAPMSEGAQRFLVVGGAECAGLPITILGGRLAHNNLHPDGEFIKLGPAGPLTLTAVNFASGVYSANWRISASSNCVSDGIPQRGTVIAVGSQFPNTEVSSGTHRFVITGSIGTNSAGKAVQIPDRS